MTSRLFRDGTSARAFSANPLRTRSRASALPVWASAAHSRAWPYRLRSAAILFRWASRAAIRRPPEPCSGRALRPSRSRLMATLRRCHLWSTGTSRSTSASAVSCAPAPCSHCPSARIVFTSTRTASRRSASTTAVFAAVTRSALPQPPVNISSTAGSPRRFRPTCCCTSAATSTKVRLASASAATKATRRCSRWLTIARATPATSAPRICRPRTPPVPGRRSGTTTKSPTTMLASSRSTAG